MFYCFLCQQSFSKHLQCVIKSIEAETCRNVTFINVLKCSCDRRSSSQSFTVELLGRAFFLHTVASLTYAEMT